MKKQLHTQLLHQLQNRKQALLSQQADAQTSANEDTKSSAGDKYETAREMASQSIRQLQQQVQIVTEQLAILERLDPDKLPVSEKIIHGSLIETESGWYYLTIAFGKHETEGKTIFVLSPQSPLGKELLTKAANETVTFNGKNLQIMKVL